MYQTKIYSQHIFNFSSNFTLRDELSDINLLKFYVGPDPFKEF